MTNTDLFNYWNGNTWSYCNLRYIWYSLTHSLTHTHARNCYLGTLLSLWKHNWILRTGLQCKHVIIMKMNFTSSQLHWRKPCGTGCLVAVTAVFGAAALPVCFALAFLCWNETETEISSICIYLWQWGSSDDPSNGRMMGEWLSSRQFCPGWDQTLQNTNQ